MSTTTTPDEETKAEPGEDVLAKIDAIMQGTAADDAEDEKPETDDADDGDAETDDTAADEGDEEAEDEDAGQEEESWIDDDARGLASAFGLTDEQLSAMSGRDELERALTLIDSYAMNNAAKDSDGEQQTETVERHPEFPDRRPDGTLLPKDQRQGEQKRQDGEFKIELDPEVHGQDLVDQISAMHAHYETKLSELANGFAQVQQVERQRAYEAFIGHFDATIDAMGLPDFFGETGKESPEQMERRKTLLQDYQHRQSVHAQSGRQVALNKSFLNWVARGAFPDHFFKKDRKALTQKVMKQSGRRLGESVNRPSNPKVSAEEKILNRFDEILSET